MKENGFEKWRRIKSIEEMAGEIQRGKYQEENEIYKKRRGVLGRKSMVKKNEENLRK